MKKIIICFLAICTLLCGNVFAAENIVLTGVISEVYITDSMGDKVQCLILTLDEEKTFDVYDDMGDKVQVSTKEIQLSSKDYKSDMIGKRVKVKGNDLLQGVSYYHIRPVVLLNAEIIPAIDDKAPYPDYVEAYVKFVQKALTVQDENSNGNNRISELQLIDLDFNSVPELIIFDGGSGGSIGINIISLVNGVAKIRYGSSYFSNEAFEKDMAVAYTDRNSQIGLRLYNCVGELSDSFELRRDGKGELFWYLKSTEENGETCMYSAYKCEKSSNFPLNNIATSAYEAEWGTDPQLIWKMFFVTTTPEQGYRIKLPTRNSDYSLNSEWETIKNSPEKLKEWIFSYEIQDIYDGPQARIFVNNTQIVTDNLTIIRDGRTLVPLRAIFEALGSTVDWNDETQTITSIRGNTTIIMTVGQNNFYKNGVSIALDVAPQITDNHTLVPVRAIAEAFDCEVVWDGDTYTVFISSKI